MCAVTLTVCMFQGEPVSRYLHWGFMQYGRAPFTGSPLTRARDNKRTTGPRTKCLRVLCLVWWSHMLLLRFFHVRHGHFFGRSPSSGANGVVYMKSRGRTVEEEEPATSPECSRRGGGAEPARIIITSLTSLGLVVGMNNIQEFVSTRAEQESGACLGGNFVPVVVFVGWNINELSVRQRHRGQLITFKRLKLQKTAKQASSSHFQELCHFVWVRITLTRLCVIVFPPYRHR